VSGLQRGVIRHSSLLLLVLLLLLLFQGVEVVASFVVITVVLNVNKKVSRLKTKRKEAYRRARDVSGLESQFIYLNKKVGIKTKRMYTS
jgi:hypothetical protein